MSREEEGLPPTAESLQTAEEDNPGYAHLSQTLLRPKQAAAPRRTGLTGRSTSCAACHTANASHAAHTYTGDCRYLPGRSIHGNAQPCEEPTRDSGIQSGTAPTDIAEPPGLDSSQTLYHTQRLITLVRNESQRKAYGLQVTPRGIEDLRVHHYCPSGIQHQYYQKQKTTLRNWLLCT